MKELGEKIINYKDTPEERVEHEKLARKEGGWSLLINEQTEGATAFGGQDAKGYKDDLTVQSKEDLRKAIKRNLSRERNEAEIDKLTDRIWDRMQKEESGTSMPRREGMKGFYGEPSEGVPIRTGKSDSLIKVKSFKTQEGDFEIYDTEKGGARGRGDMFTVFKSKDGWIIRNAFVPEQLQKKGIATDFYLKMNEESIKKTGKPLRSTQERILINGERVHELSKDGISLWDSFVKKGYAIKNGEKNYSFKKQFTGKLGIVGAVAKALVKELTGKPAEIVETKVKLADKLASGYDVTIKDENGRVTTHN